MLLRSASTPLLNSLARRTNPRDSPGEHDVFHQIPRARSVCVVACCSSQMSLSSSGGKVKRVNRTLSEADLQILSGVSVEEECEEVEEEEIGFRLLNASSLGTGLGFGVPVEEGCEVSLGAGVGGSGGKMCGGGDGRDGGSDGGDGDGDWASWDSNRGNDNTEVYYQKMIEANPGNALLLSNYARFLKEVRADYVKAEEYCGRAILANPNDANVLSMYADLIWQSHKDASRAESYFDQAVKAAPDDCYVLASYARFLWDAEDEEGDEGEEKEEDESQLTQAPQPNFLHGISPVTVAY